MSNLVAPSWLDTNAPGAVWVVVPGLQRHDVDSLCALGAGLDLELDFLVLRKRLEAVVHSDLTVMNGEFLASLIRDDETETLCVVEPLHRAGGHVLSKKSQLAAVAAGLTA